VGMGGEGNDGGGGIGEGNLLDDGRPADDPGALQVEEEEEAAEEAPDPGAFAPFPDEHRRPLPGEAHGESVQGEQMQGRDERERIEVETGASLRQRAVICWRRDRLGERVLQGLPFLPEILPSARHHHERWDGRGYPNGLVGEAIPADAAILAVANSFDAMTRSRTYHGARLSIRWSVVTWRSCARPIARGAATVRAPSVRIVP